MWKHPLTWLTLTGLLAVVILWDPDGGRLLETAPEVEPDFPQAYLQQADTLAFNEQGQPAHRLRGERVEHFQRGGEADYSLVKAPEITVFGEGPPWQLTARRGRAESGGERLIFRGSVRAWRERDEGPVEITTERLLIEPERQYAETDKAVMMRNPRARHTAVGLRARLDRDRIELLSEVKGTYEPPPES